MSITLLTIEPNIVVLDRTGSPVLLGKTFEQWGKAQMEDPVLSHVIYFLACGQPPGAKERSPENPGVVKILRQWSQLAIHEGLLFRTIQVPLELGVR